MVETIIIGGVLPDFPRDCYSDMFTAPTVSVFISVAVSAAKKLRVYIVFGSSLTVADVEKGLTDLLSFCKVSLQTLCPLHLFVSWKLSLTIDSSDVFLPEPTPLGRSWIPSFTLYMCEVRAHLASRLELDRFAVFSALFTKVFLSELSPTVADVHPVAFAVSLCTLHTCCTTEAASGGVFVSV